MEEVHHAFAWNASMVRAKLAIVGGGALLLALLALSIPICIYSAVQAVLPRAHHELALEAKVHTAKNSILELQRF